jgi:hypothetical protein
MRSLIFFNLLNPYSRTTALECIQPKTERVPENLPGGKERPVRKPDKLTAICEPIVCKVWDPPRPVTVMALFTFILYSILMVFIFVSFSALSVIEYVYNRFVRYLIPDSCVHMDCSSY